MRLNINLATKPYQDVRHILLQWGWLVVLLAFCTCTLVGTAISRWREAHEISQKIETVRSEITDLDRRQTAAQAILTNGENRSTVEAARFLNGLIARKSFSWTRVFMQLEQILPPHLHVVAITPQLQTETNTVEVRLRVGGNSRDAAVELVKRLEQSTSFRNPRIVEENMLTAEDSDTAARPTAFGGMSTPRPFGAMPTPRPTAFGAPTANARFRGFDTAQANSPESAPQDPITFVITATYVPGGGLILHAGGGR